MSLSTRINQLFQYWKAAFPQLNISPGTVSSAIGSGVGMLQNDNDVLVDQIQQNAFIQTATGNALDALAADRGIIRNPASAATGSVTLTRSDSSTNLSGSAGVQISTNNNDPTTNIVFTTTSGFTFTVGQLTASVSAVADTPGSVGNIATGGLTNLITTINGVVSVTNNMPMTGGADRETDTALRQRIFASLTPANSLTRLKGVVLGITGVASAAVFDQQDFNGNFLVYANDVSGTLYTPLQNTILNTVNANKPLGTTGTILAPTMTLITIGYSYAVQSGWAPATVQNAINVAINNYFNALVIGQTFRVYDMVSQILGNVPGKQAVPGILDFLITTPITAFQTALPWQIFRPGTITATQITS